MTEHEAQEIYRERNNNGEGYAVGRESDEIFEVKEKGLVFHYMVSDDLAVYEGPKGLVLVGDSNGPWAVDVEAK